MERGMKMDNIICPICNKPIEELRELDFKRKRDRILFRILVTKILQQYKKENGLTLRELSRKLESKYSVTVIDRWIQGHVIPRFKTAKFIIERLKQGCMIYEES